MDSDGLERMDGQEEQAAQRLGYLHGLRTHPGYKIFQEALAERHENTVRALALETDPQQLQRLSASLRTLREMIEDRFIARGEGDEPCLRELLVNETQEELDDMHEEAETARLRAEIAPRDPFRLPARGY